MAKEQTRPERLIAVRRADLTKMAGWKCIRPATEGPCTTEQIVRGECCRSCWASHFAEQALRGASVRLPKVKELPELDVWDLLNSFGETVRQFGGGFCYDFTTGKAYIRAPKLTGATVIPLHVVDELPKEVFDGA